MLVNVRCPRFRIPCRKQRYACKRLVEVYLNDEITVWEGPSNLEGRYANCFKVGYNAFELVIDFGQVAGEDGHAWITGRILTNPRAAKALSDTLRQTVEEYERIFGVIQDKEG